MAILEKGSAPERSLAPEAGHRIILRLVSSDASPLEQTGASRLNRLLRGEKARPGYHVRFTTGKYYVELEEQTESDEAALTHAVAETDTAIANGDLPVVLDAAWVLPADAPTIGRLTPEALDQLPAVTPLAKDIFVEHHAQLMTPALINSLYHSLYDVA